MAKNTECLENSVLTKKDVMGAWARWQVFAEMTHSYERMQAVAVATSLGKCLRKIYANDDEKYKRALQRHLVFFNTEGNWGGAVLGMTIAMEEQMKDNDEDEKDEVINEMKTSLMGPVAGLGDSMDWGTLKPIICGLGLALSMNGSFAGVILCLVFCFTILLIGRQCWWIGYSKGAQAMATIVNGSAFKKIIKSASLLGLFMMGVLTASYVSCSTVLQIPTGDSMLAIQDVLDSIIPGILPLASVLGIYGILKKKTQKFGLISIGIVVLSILLALVKVL